MTTGDAPCRRLRCAFAYASPRVQYLVELDLPAGATADAARRAARLHLAAGEGVLSTVPQASGDAPTAAEQALREMPWEGGRCAVFGQEADWSTPLQDGDRVELLRPLAVDPRTGRRNRVAEARRRSGRPPAGPEPSGRR